LLNNDSAKKLPFLCNGSNIHAPAIEEPLEEVFSLGPFRVYTYNEGSDEGKIQYGLNSMAAFCERWNIKIN
jgi:hypothetical protein